MPKKMIIGLIQYTTYWLNNIAKSGQDNSPRDLILGEQKLDYKVICRIPFGAYAQVHDDLKTTNTMEARTTGVINMGPTGNVQGTHKFLSLKTGENIVRRNWTEMPIPSEAIVWIQELSGKEEIDFDNDESEDYIQGTNYENKEESHVRDQMDTELEAMIHEEREPRPEDHDDTKTRESEDNQDDVEKRMGRENDEQIPNGHMYNLREKRDRDYSYRFMMLSVKSGLKRWGDKAKEGLLYELKLFMTEKVLEQIKFPTDLQRKKALRIHCFITEKRDARIKARVVVDGRSQARYLEEQTYSPTIKLESIMLCTLIEALAGREVSTIDIKGAFLKAKVPEDMDLVVRMDGELAELFCEMNPKFTKKVEEELYLKCLKALYGHIEAALLFYNELDYSLTKRMGFKRNSFDPCVYNRQNEGDEAVMIRTHVDDLKVSSKSRQLLNQVAIDLGIYIQTSQKPVIKHTII
jgi:hypothetical protein